MLDIFTRFVYTSFQSKMFGLFFSVYLFLFVSIFYFEANEMNTK